LCPGQEHATLPGHAFVPLYNQRVGGYFRWGKLLDGNR